MSKSGQFKVQLYDYEKLNTNSLFRRLTTDIEGERLSGWRLDDNEPAEKWQWIQT
jgi:hypothetical protein